MIFEIGVSDEQSIRFLLQNGVEEAMAKSLVDVMGGRIVHLQSAVVLLEGGGWNDIHMIKWKLFSKILNAQTNFIMGSKPESEKIIEMLSKIENVLVSHLFDKAEDQKRMITVFQEMVNNNTLRYWENGFVTWHSRIQENEFKVK